MQPVTSGLKQFHAPAAQTAAVHGCRAKSSCKDKVAEDQSCPQVRSVKKALMQHVVATLRARLEVVVGGPAKVAGLSDGEQASNQLANAVSTALQSTGSPDDVRASVEDGLQEAATSLRQSGASAGDLDTALADLTDKLDSLFAAFTPPASTLETNEVTTAGARVVTKEKGVLEIRTQDGDVVKVKFATKTDVRAGAAEVTTGDLVVNASSLSITSESRTHLSVKGDLNADELKAIADVVQKVEALANEFFAGNVDEALSQAADLDIDTDQLANVALRLSMRQRIEAHAVTVRPAAVEAPSIPPAEVQSPTEDHDAATPSVPASEAAPVVSGEENAAATADESAVSVMPSQTLPAETTDDSSPQTVVAKFVARVLATFQSNDGDTRVSLSFKMKLQLLTSAIEAKQPDVSAQAHACVKRLGDVAEAAAAT